MFDDEQVTDDLTMKFVEQYPYFCEGFCIVREFEIHYRKSIKDEQSLRKIYDSLSRLLKASKIVWTEEGGYNMGWQEMADNEQIADDLTLKLVDAYPLRFAKDSHYCCTKLRIVREFEIHYHKLFTTQQSLRKILTSIQRLLNTGKIVWDEEIGYKVAKNG